MWNKSYSQVICLSSSVLDALGKKAQALKARSFSPKKSHFFGVWTWCENDVEMMWTWCQKWTWCENGVKQARKAGYVNAFRWVLIHRHGDKWWNMVFFTAPNKANYGMKLCKLFLEGTGGVSAAHVAWVVAFPSWLVRPTKRSWSPAIRRLRHVAHEVAWYSRRWISPECHASWWLRMPKRQEKWDEFW